MSAIPTPVQHPQVENQQNTSPSAQNK
jgi:hypothetical protein